MSNSTKYVGLDVSKSKIAVAIAEEGRQEPRYWGAIPHTKEAIRKHAGSMFTRRCSSR